MPEKRFRERNYLSDAEKIQAVEPNFTKSWWGEIELTDAVRPVDPQTCLQRGFDTFAYHEQGKRPPVIVVSETRTNVFPLLTEALSLLGEAFDTPVDVWLTSYEETKQDFVSDDCELVIAQSKLWDWQDLWLNNGAAGIAFCKRDTMSEIQLDDHKSVIIYTGNRKLFQMAKQLLRKHDLEQKCQMAMIWQIEHCHCTDVDLIEQFQAACVEFNASPHPR